MIKNHFYNYIINLSMKKLNYVIDTHTHLGFWKTIKECENNLLYNFNNYNLSYALVSIDQTEIYREGLEVMPFLKSLDYILDFVNRNKGFGILIWFRTLHYSKNDVIVLDKFINEHRDLIHGLKFHPTLSKTKCTSKKLIPFLNLARKYSLPILVHTALDEYANIEELGALAKNNSDINFIAAHLELGSNNKCSLTKIKEIPNLYGDTAWVNMESLREAKKLNIIRKIMFGSDSPIDGKDTLNHKFYQGYFNNKIGLRKDDYDKLMYKNALKIYSINEKDLITRYQWDKSHH